MATPILHGFIIVLDHEDPFKIVVHTVIMRVSIVSSLGLSLSSWKVICAFQHQPQARARRFLTALGVNASPSSQLAQLAEVTTLSIDSGDLKVIEEYAATGYITDATTNPLFVSQVIS